MTELENKMAEAKIKMNRAWSRFYETGEDRFARWAKHWTDVYEKLNEEKKNGSLFRQQDSFTITLREGQYVFHESFTGKSHSISADPGITSPERLEAHWLGFVQNVRLHMPTSDTMISELKQRVKTVRDQLRREAHVDFVARELEVIPLDADGERIDSLMDFTDSLTKSQIDGMFEDPEVAGISIISTGRAFEAPDLPIREKYEYTAPVEWADVIVIR